jgi:hypothetical protein
MTSRLQCEADLRASLGDVAEEITQEARDAPSAWDIPGLGGHAVRRRASHWEASTPSVDRMPE